MGEYDSAIELAKRLIAEKGQDATLRNLTPGSLADSNKPWKPGATTNVDKTVRAVFLGYAQKFIDGTSIKTGDQRVLMAATDTSGAAVAPQVDGLVLRGSEKWKIIAIKPLNPAGEPIMYTVQVRQ